VSLPTKLVVPIATALVVTALTTGCNPRDRAQPLPTSTQTIARSPSPAPTITVLRSAQALEAGQTATLRAQAGVSLQVRAGRPQVSRTRLSSSYGYAPAHGYYVTIPITIVNTGDSPVAIGPANFRLRVTGEGTVTSNDGNAPFSGAAEQLDTTQVDPGQTLRGPVTFDVRRPHGTLSYFPDRTAAVTWRF
jgi:hypothetical protein